jgi:DNA-binding Lrp family transcriptional regulator
MELAACDAVLKYLIFCSEDLDNCGENAMAKRLGIKRSRLHRLLTNLEWNGIIRRVGVGTTSPYKVSNLGKALGEGYVSFDQSEADHLTRIMNPYTTTLLGEILLPAIPNDEVLTETAIKVINRMVPPGGEVGLIPVSFNPGRIARYIKGLRELQITSGSIQWPLLGQFQKEVLMELGVPDHVEPEDIENALRQLSEKYLKLMRMNIKPLLDLLLIHGLEKTKAMIEKAYHRDTIITQRQDSKGRSIPRQKIYRDTDIISDISIVPEHGLITHNTHPLTSSHIHLLASVYQHSCGFVEYMDGDPDLLRICKEEARQLANFGEQSQDR